MLGSGGPKMGLRVDEGNDGIRRLPSRYGVRMSLADACDVRMRGIVRGSRVFTLDRSDFAVYRRSGRAVIPIIAP